MRLLGKVEGSVLMLLGPNESVRQQLQSHAQVRGVDPARLMNIVGKTRGAQFTPAGVLLLPLQGETAAGDILRFLAEKLSQLGV